jgi:hypothetical protein
MTDQEWMLECLKETAQDVGKGLLIYAVVAGSYWLTIG